MQIGYEGFGQIAENWALVDIRTHVWVNFRHRFQAGIGVPRDCANLENICTNLLNADVFWVNNKTETNLIAPRREF